MIQKQSKDITVEGPTITNSKKGAAGSEFNKEHAFFFREGDCSL
jgi:hypothetical protein